VMYLQIFILERNQNILSHCSLYNICNGNPVFVSFDWSCDGLSIGIKNRVRILIIGRDMVKIVFYLSLGPYLFLLCFHPRVSRKHIACRRFWAQKTRIFQRYPPIPNPPPSNANRSNPVPLSHKKKKKKH
jgi:hypothetical protein